jgi:glycosyltransferase involved in cell wall biosynthesis
MPAPRRLAVITTEIGTRSEVWMMRQLEAFTSFHATLFGWSLADNGVPPPAGVESRLFARGDPRKFSLANRLRRRLGLASAYLPDPAVRREIAAELAAVRPDAVLCHFGWTATAVATALPPGVPLILHVHGRDVSVMLDQPAYRAALGAILPRVQHLVVVGHFQIGRLARFFPLPPHSVIPCGAPTGLFAARPCPVRHPGEPIRFVSIGRTSDEKGPLQNLAAFEALHRQHPDSCFTIIGEGPLDQELDAAIAQSPARAAVDRPGYQAPSELAETLSSCHVLLQHSRMANGSIEGFGVTLTEGGASGLPLVATRVGGIPDQVIDGQNGFLFEQDDVEAQTAAMLRLATDEPLRQRMGSAARAIALGFDSTTQARKLEALILDLIDRPALR